MMTRQASARASKKAVSLFELIQNHVPFEITPPLPAVADASDEDEVVRDTIPAR